MRPVDAAEEDGPGRPLAMSARGRLARLVCALLLSGGAAPAAAQDNDDEQIRVLLDRLEGIVLHGDSSAFESVLAGTNDAERVRDFASLELRGGATRVVMQERDRQHLQGTLPGNGYRLAVDALVETGDRARISTLQLDIRRAQDGWRIVDQERLSVVDNLYRLSVTADKQFAATNLKITAEDLELTLVEGTVFVIEIDRGITGLVLLGRGEMVFTPAPETEKGQVKIFAGAESLATRFDAAFIRASNVAAHVDLARLVPRPVDRGDLRRALQIFRDESPKSFALDLADLTRDTWSLLPNDGDFLAEVRTRRFNTLTYSRSRAESEDISVFDRRRSRTISAYASLEKLASRGRFYNEDDSAAYDVLDYDIDVSYTPARRWIAGQATLYLRARMLLGQITLRLARSLVVQSVYSDELGRLFHLRVRDHDTVLVNLPVGLMPDTPLALTVVYAGRLESQVPGQEMQLPDRDLIPRGVPEDMYLPRPEPSFLYSNRSYWYPQSPISDYATATIRITVPAAYSCVATGELSADSPTLIPGEQPSQSLRAYVFTANRPARYLAFIAGRMAIAEQSTIEFEAPGSGEGDGASESARLFGAYGSLAFAVHAQPRQVQRGREVARQTADIARFYESIVGDSPYRSLTLAVVESLLPGGHSPPYVAVVNEPLPGTPLAWRNDPAAFNNYPEFFLAHEVAHQWWGHAVGWQNYHEQWLSEGFAQYFAALYAQHLRGDEVFGSVLRQLRRWSIDQSDQGPVHLGYRLGHVKDESRIFRALVYNKGAAVLHMLRRLIGDEAFFQGLRKFYSDMRFRKAGTEDLRAAMEAVAGRSLGRFFERWIYGSTLPVLRLSYRVASGGGALVLRIDQDGEELFDVPVTVELHYEDRTVDVLIPVTEATVEVTVPLRGVLREVKVPDEAGTLAHVEVS